MEQERFYRRLHKAKDLVHFKVRVGETDLDIAAEKILTQKARNLIVKYRRDIEDYIKETPEFLTSLKPLSPKSNAPSIVKEMSRGAKKAGVGPMATVAGAIAKNVGEGLCNYCREIIVENGGDIYIRSSHKRVIGIYAGESPLSGKIGIRIKAEDSPLGVCTSSGKVGHSLSFGNAHAVTIISKDVILADGVATAVGNMVNTTGDIKKGIAMGRDICGVSGIIVIIDDKFGAWGDLELVKL